jgi:hypothetical protein
MAKRNKQENPVCIFLDDGTVVPGEQATEEQLAAYWEDQGGGSESVRNSDRPGHGKNQRNNRRGGDRFY